MRNMIKQFKNKILQELKLNAIIYNIQINYQLKNQAIYTNVKPTVNKFTDKNQKRVRYRNCVSTYWATGTQNDPYVRRQMNEKSICDRWKTCHSPM